MGTFILGIIILIFGLVAVKQQNGKLSVVSTDNTMTLIDMNDINKVAD